MTVLATQVIWLTVAFGLMICIGYLGCWCSRSREIPISPLDRSVFLLFLISIIVLGLFIHASYVWVALTLSALTAYAVVDAKTGYVFDLSLCPLALVAIFHALFASGGDVLGGLAVGVGMFGLPYLLTNGGGMGLGDVKVSLAVGSILGPTLAFTAFTLAFISGAIFGLACRKSVPLGAPIPFVPFVLIGTVLAGGYLIYAFR